MSREKNDIPEASLTWEKRYSETVDKYEPQEKQQSVGFHETPSQEKKYSKDAEELPKVQNEELSKAIELPVKEKRNSQIVEESSGQKRKSPKATEESSSQDKRYSKIAERSSSQEKKYSTATDELSAEERKYSKVVEESTQERKDSIAMEPSSVKQNKLSSVTEELDNQDKKKKYSTTIKESPMQEKKHSIVTEEAPIQERKLSKELPIQEKKNSTLNESPIQEPSAREKKLSTIPEEPSKQEMKYSRQESQTQELKYSKTVSETSRQSKRYSKSVHDAPTSAKRYSVVIPELPMQGRKISEVIEELPAIRQSKVGSEVTRREPRYSRVIEELEAQIEKRKSIIERILEKKNSSNIEDAREKKLRFGDEEISKTETSMLSVAKGMRLQYKPCPRTCESFLRVEEFSSLFVDDIIEEALVKNRMIKIESSTKIVEGIEYLKDEEKEKEEDYSSYPSVGTYVCVLEWPTIEQFTIELGANKILEYFSYWKFEEDWKYCVNYLKGESDAACDFHHYEAIFSIPCKQYPIPQATASLYFTFEVSRVKPKHCLVDVYFSFEGRRLIQTPGQFKLQEEWLFHIIDAKINFYKTLTF